MIDRVTASMLSDYLGDHGYERWWTSTDASGKASQPERTGQCRSASRVDYLAAKCSICCARGAARGLRRLNAAHRADYGRSGSPGNRL